MQPKPIIFYHINVYYCTAWAISQLTLANILCQLFQYCFIKYILIRHLTYGPPCIQQTHHSNSKCLCHHFDSSPNQTISAHNITFSITYFMNSLPNLLNNKYKYHKSVFIPMCGYIFLNSYHIVLSFQKNFVIFRMLVTNS